MKKYALRSKLSEQKLMTGRGPTWDLDYLTYDSDVTKAITWDTYAEAKAVLDYIQLRPWSSAIEIVTLTPITQYIVEEV